MVNHTDYRQATPAELAEDNRRMDEARLVQRHASRPEMPKATANHGCRFLWCDSDEGASVDQRREHSCVVAQVSVSGDPRTAGDPANLSVSLYFHETFDQAPTVYLSEDAEEGHVLTIEEAIRLHQALGAAINAVTGGEWARP